MSTSPIEKPEPVISKRSVGWAGAAALVGCVACCAIPLLAAAGIGGGLAASLSSVFRPGFELIVGPVAFLLVLGVMAGRARMKKGSTAQTGPACAVGCGCRAHGASQGR